MNRILIVSLFLLFASSANAQSDSASPAKKFGIKSGKIIYQFKGESNYGERIFIFDDWGNWTKQIITSHIDIGEMKKSLGITDSISSAAVSKERREMIITMPKGAYHIDLDRKIGNFGDYDGDFLGTTKAYAKFIRNEVYLGRPCEVQINLDIVKLWIWKGIMLKNELLKRDGDIRTSDSAVYIDESYQIKPDEFTVPKDIKIRVPAKTSK